MNNAYFCGFCESSGIDFPYIGHMGAPNDFGRKYGRKNDQNLTNFFYKQKTFKSAQKNGFIKIGPKLVILTYSLQDMKNPLPLKVAPTVNLRGAKIKIFRYISFGRTRGQIAA